MEIIDLRSDTVTRPTMAMKEAMLSASLGDDVFGEDPTVNELEMKAAALFGMEAALFCPSGTMTNQIAIRVHTRPGDEVLCSHLAHIYNYEGGGIASNSGCQTQLIPGERGMFSVDALRKQLKADDVHFPHSRLVSLENTSNKGGGAIWNNDEIVNISQYCRENNLALHLDGARLFNAIVAGKSSTTFFGQQFDSISICLSKGLGAPVGSLLLGTAEFIHRARRVRKSFGGGMRQAGILAAAGIFALENHIERLSTDHENARIIADTWKQNNYVESVLPVETNIVIARLHPHVLPADILEKWKNKGLLGVAMGHDLLRLVTHLDLSSSHMEKTLEILKDVN